MRHLVFRSSIAAVLFSMLGTLIVVSPVYAVNTILGSEYADSDDDGTVDLIEWSFDENVTACAYEAGDWTVNTAGDINVAITGLSCTGTDTILRILVTADAGETGGTTNPVISYADAGTTGSVTLTSGDMTAKPSQEIFDGAAPLIVGGSYADSGPVDGKIDRFVVLFSETIVAASIIRDSNIEVSNVGDFTGIVVDNSGTDRVVADSGGFTVFTSGTGGAQATVVDTFDDSGNFEIELTGGFNLEDAEGNFNTVAAVQPATFDDEAAPRVETTEYEDTDGNGKIDQVVFTWSEDIIGATSVLTEANIDFTDAGDFVGAAFGSDTGTDLLAADTDTITVPIETEASTVDTSEDSGSIAISLLGSFRDAASNLLTSDTGLANTFIDGASPVIAAVSPVEGSDAREYRNIVITFSEAMDPTFDAGTEYDVVADPGNLAASFTGNDHIVTITHDDFPCDTTITVTTDEAEIDSANAEPLLTTGPQDGDWTFDVDCSSGSDGGGGSPTPLESNQPLIEITDPTAGETLTVDSFFDIFYDISGSGIASIDLEYSTPTIETEMIALNLEGADGSYSWQVPSSLSGQTVTITATAYDSGKATLDTDIVEAEVSASAEEEEEPVVTPEEEEAGVTVDAEGRKVADGTGTFGTSPFNGEEQEISQIEAGWFVRGFGSSTVYYLDENLVRHPLWDAVSYFTYNDSWDDAIWITDATLPTLEIGSPQLPNPGVVLVKITTDDRVYWVEEGAEGAFVLRWVTSESVASQMFGSSWADFVIDIDTAVFPYYETGADITFAEEVDTSLMMTRMELALLASE